MATATATKETPKKEEQKAPSVDQTEMIKQTGEVRYTPFGAATEIKLTRGIVRKYWGNATKNGVEPTDQDCDIFLMTCVARGLNPWLGDAYLVGYDAKDGAKFSTITAIQALYKRAELSGRFNGIESGVIYRLPGEDAKADAHYEQGDFVPPGATLLGGWARVFRTDIERPFFEAIGMNRAGRNSRWECDGNGMICKVAEAGALRRAFPTECGGLYANEEMNDENTIAATSRRIDSQPSQRIESSPASLTDAFRKPQEARQPAPVERASSPPQPDMVSPQEIVAIMDQIARATTPEGVDMATAVARKLVNDQRISIEQFDEILRCGDERFSMFEQSPAE